MRTRCFPLSAVVWPLDRLTRGCCQSCSCDTRQRLLKIHSNINNWLWRHFHVDCAMCESLISLYFAFLSAANRSTKNNEAFFHLALCFNQVKYLSWLFLWLTLAALVHLAVLQPWHDVLSKQNHYCFHKDIRTEPGNRFHSNRPIRCDTKAHGFHQNLHCDGNLACAWYSTFSASVHQQKWRGSSLLLL